jgi:hypothetical protein
MGLADDQGAVVRVDEALLAQLRVDDRLGNAVVSDDRAEPAALADRTGWGDDELAAGASPGGRSSADLNRSHGEPGQVEVERRQCLRRTGIDAGGTGQQVGGGLVLLGW